MVETEWELDLDLIDNVATLPIMATEFLKIIRDKKASIRQISKVIEKDSSITVKILKIANSPLWGVPGRVESVQRALVLLGLKQVSNIVIAVSLYSAYAGLKPNPYFDRKAFWMHSMGTAYIARNLSNYLHINFQGEEFASGLIHDLGKMILDQYWGEEFRNVIIKAKQTQQSVLAVEKQSLGYSHAEIGAKLLQKWNFPKTIVTAVQYHHTPALAPEMNLLVAVISLADMICEKAEVGVDPDARIENIEECACWKIIETQKPKINELPLDEFITGIKSELNSESSLPVG